MPFQERSAWVMSVALLLGGLFYFGVVVAMSLAIGRLAPPLLPVVAVYTVLLTLLAIAGHIVIAVRSPKEANAKLDERERKVVIVASHRSGYVLGAGVLCALGVYLFTYSGNLLFYSIFASLMISQLAEYTLQIVAFRTTI